MCLDLEEDTSLSVIKTANPIKDPGQKRKKRRKGDSSAQFFTAKKKNTKCKKKKERKRGIQLAKLSQIKNVFCSTCHILIELNRFHIWTKYKLRTFLGRNWEWLTMCVSKLSKITITAVCLDCMVIIKDQMELKCNAFSPIETKECCTSYSWSGNKLN